MKKQRLKSDPKLGYCTEDNIKIVCEALRRLPPFLRECLSEHIFDERKLPARPMNHAELLNEIHSGYFLARLMLDLILDEKNICSIAGQKYNLLIVEALACVLDEEIEAIEQLELPENIEEHKQETWERICKSIF